MLRIQFSPIVREKRQPQSNGWILGQTRQLLTLFGEHTQKVRTRLEKEFGVLEGMDAYLSQIAIALEPEPFGLANLYNRNPYINPEKLRVDLNGAVERGWLETVREGVYQATEKSRCYYRQLCREINQAYLGMRSLPASQLAALERLLEKVLQVMAEDAQLAYTPALDFERQLSNVCEYPLQRVCSLLAQWLAYHDDAYMNAWMEQEVNAFVWEAFSLIYKGEARTVTDLTRELQSLRRYDATVYQLAVDELEARDWIYMRNRRYEPTISGLSIVSQVARKMNHDFYAPIKTLSDKEHKKLQELMEALAERLALGVKQSEVQPAYGQSFRAAVQWAWAHVR